MTSLQSIFIPFMEEILNARPIRINYTVNVRVPSDHQEIIGMGYCAPKSLGTRQKKIYFLLNMNISQHLSSGVIDLLALWSNRYLMGKQMDTPSDIFRCGLIFQGSSVGYLMICDPMLLLFLMFHTPLELESLIEMPPSILQIQKDAKLLSGILTNIAACNRLDLLINPIGSCHCPIDTILTLADSEWAPIFHISLFSRRILSQSKDSEFQEKEQEQESISLDPLLDEENRHSRDVLMDQITNLIENSKEDPEWEFQQIDPDLEPFLGWDEILPSIRMNVRQQLDTFFHDNILNLDNLLLFNPSSSQKHAYMRTFQSQFPLDRAFHFELFQELSNLIPVISPALCDEKQPNRSLDIDNHKEDFENIGSFLTLKEQGITQIRVNHHIPYYSDAGFGLFQLNHPNGTPTLYLIRFVTHKIFRDALPSLIVWVLCEFSDLQMYSYLVPQTIRKEKYSQWQTFWRQWWGNLSYELHDLTQRILMIQKAGIQLDFLIENSTTAPTITKYLRSPEYWEDIAEVCQYDSTKKQYIKQDEQELNHYKTYQQQLATDRSSDIDQDWINPQEMNDSQSTPVTGDKK